MVRINTMDNSSPPGFRATTVGECRTAVARAAVGKGSGAEHEVLVETEAAWV